LAVAVSLGNCGGERTAPPKSRWPGRLIGAGLLLSFSLPLFSLDSEQSKVFVLQLGVWPLHHRYVIAALAFCLLEVFLIAGLLLQLKWRRRAEEEQLRLNRKLHAISNCSQVLLRAGNEQDLLNEICRIVCDEAGYHTAWVGVAEHDDAKTVRPVAWAGGDNEFFENIKVTWADSELGQGPTGTAIRTGQVTCFPDLAADPRFAPWLDALARRGDRSAVSLPLKDDNGNVFGALCIYSEKVNAFTPDEVALLEELAGDLAFGVVSLRARAKLKQAEQDHLAHLHFLESMDRINRTIQGTTDPERMMDDLLDTVWEIFACDRAFLLRATDPEAKMWSLVRQRTRPEFPGVLALGQPLPGTEDIAEAHRIVLRASGPVKFCPETGYLPPPELRERFQIQSAMVVALHPKTGPPWQLGIQQCSYPRVWKLEEERLLEAIAQRVSDALDTLLAYHNLRESEQRLTLALQVGSIGVFERDLQDGSSFCTPEVAEIWGLPRGFAGDLYAYCWEHVHPGDLERVREASARILERHEEAEVECRVLRPDGATRWIRWLGKVLPDRAGELRRMILVTTDITASKEAEEELRHSESMLQAVFAASPVAIMVLAEGVIVRAWNKAAERMFGWTAEETIGRQPPMVPPDRWHEVLELREQLWQGKILLGKELKRVRKDGGVLDVSFSASSLKDAGGRIIGAVGVYDDYTERKRLQEQLLQAQKMESIGHLAGGIAHDFNNILNIVNGYSELLLANPEVGGLVRQRLEEILAAGQRAAALTRQLLAFSRKQILQPKVLNLNLVFEGIDKMLRRLIGEHIEIKSVLELHLRPVKADPSQMEQVILNLCLNARDAMPEGGILTLETANVEIDEPQAAQHFSMKPGSYVRLTVTDNGNGMDQQTLSHVFEPFFTTKGPEGGTGLGLATVYGIVNQSGGHLSVSSKPGCGTTFSMYLPAAPEEAEGIELGMKPGEIASGSETILLVEDAAPLRSLARIFLESSGYTVLEAADGEQAVRLAERHEGDIALLLTDVSLPKIMGPSLAKQLLQQKPGMKVLYVSGCADNFLVPGGLLEPGTAFLQKPYTAAALTKRVREVLDMSQSNLPASCKIN